MSRVKQETIGDNKEKKDIKGTLKILGRIIRYIGKKK